MTDTIKLQTKDRVTTLTISRPDKRNALTQDMYAAMADAIEAYGQSDDARAFVITGEGEYFTAGNDLMDFSMADRGAETPPVMRFIMAILDCPKPLICAVNGPAIGIGLTMLLHADLCFAAQSATINAPFVKLSVVPEAGSSILLPATVGMAVANDILLAGRVLSADEAHGYGLISRVLPDADFHAQAHEIAAQVAASSPTAMRKSKALIRSNREEIRAQILKESAEFLAQLKSPDFAESVAALMEKRAPNYD